MTALVLAPAWVQAQSFVAAGSAYQDSTDMRNYVLSADSMGSYGAIWWGRPLDIGQDSLNFRFYLSPGGTDSTASDVWFVLQAGGDSAQATSDSAWGYNGSWAGASLALHFELEADSMRLSVDTNGRADSASFTTWMNWAPGRPQRYVVEWWPQSDTLLLLKDCDTLLSYHNDTLNTITGTDSLWWGFASANRDTLDAPFISLLSDSILAFYPDTFSYYRCDSLHLDISPHHSAAQNFLWSPADSISRADTLNPSLFPDTIMQYTLQYTLCHTDTIRESIWVQPDSFYLDLGADTTLCYGDTLMIDISYPRFSYLWSHDSTASGLAYLDQENTYYVTMSKDACHDVDTLSLSLDTLSLELGRPIQHLCQDNDKYLFSGDTLGTYLWNDSSTHHTLFIPDTGKYWVRGQLGGCVKSDTVVFDTIIPPTKIDKPIIEHVSCYDSTDGNVKITTVVGNIPVDEFLWSNDSTGPWLDSVKAGDYTVSVVNDSGCIYTEDFTLNQPDEITYEVLKCEDGWIGFQISTEGGIRPYHYSPDSVTYYPDSAFWDPPKATYHIRIRDSAGCYSAIEEFEYDPCASEIEIPNIWVLNGSSKYSLNKQDGSDQWYLLYFEMYIYDQWGQLVFHTKDPYQGWDGSIDGGSRMVKSGVFYVMVYYQKPDEDKTRKKKGFFHCVVRD